MKKKLTIILIILLVLAVGHWAWQTYAGETRIAFVNFQTITLGAISKANENGFIKISEVSTDELDKLSGFDMIFLNGMGLRIVEEQRANIEKAAASGIPIYTSMATNPANNICNLDSIQETRIQEYLTNGGRKNYRSLLSYVRKEIDRKKISAPEPEEAVKRASDILYHSSPTNPDDVLDFTSVEDYENFLKKNNIRKEGGKKIVVTGQMADPTNLIAALEKNNINVYPISSFRRLLEFVEQIGPDAVINLPHGRMGDKMVEYLQRKNILLFAPITINSLVENWENNPMGMSGGFLSQSVVTPEIDGAIRSFALFAQYKDEEGLHHSFAIPERLDKFIETLKAYLELKEKPNSQKRVAIYYFKGPGQNAMTAGGMEVAPSLYNLLKRLKQEGLRVDNLPANHKELEAMIMTQGAVFGNYAEGAFDDFMQNGKPELVTKEQYESWVQQTLRPEKYAEVVQANGEFPGAYMATPDGKIGVARLQFGNVVLLPQNAAGAGSNSFQVVHGTNSAPPHTYIASYLWMQHGFKADALIHFGTHGSLEYTPRKQVALSSLDWPDRLVGSVPHFYIYTISNVGEGIIAKRRGYGGLQSYLTPPFLESSVRGIYRDLMEKIKIYNRAPGDKVSLEVKSIAVKMGFHRDLGLDSVLTVPYTQDEILKLENFAEELAAEKITGQLYTMGVPYETERITSSVYAMATDPIAYSLLALDKQRGRANEQVSKNKALFNQHYLTPAKTLVGKLLRNPEQINDELICRTAGITAEELEKARRIEESRNAPTGMMAMMNAMVSSGQKMPKNTGHADGKSKMPEFMVNMMKKMAEGKDTNEIRKMFEAKSGGKEMPEAMRKMLEQMDVKKEDEEKKAPISMAEMMKERTKRASKPEYSKEEIHFALAVTEVEKTICNIHNYRNNLLNSPEQELASMINALNGGYTPPSPGGDPIVNPNSLPTGRNLYSINAEATPSEAAWEKGVQLAKNTIEMYQERHNGKFPRKVSYTLWSGEFIETNGATIAQILYMLGVEPIRDSFGRVSDLQLIPSEELGRPRIDVVVQTSGQLRDLAASRLFLINRAVEMATAARDDKYDNLVATSVVESERVLTEKGLSPKDAREMSTFRVFGGANGNYGSGIQGMVEAGDHWENESEIAEVYLNNMGAYYGNEKNWEVFRQFAFEAALTRTDVVIQPRQSNTWGALSLDHVYEFMGGMNLAVRNVTGKDPDAYLSDYRNRNNVRMQELKEAIGVESRTTIFNPSYIKEKMKGEATTASSIAETIRNTYGWNVMKPSVIDNELWDEIYNVYVKDKFNLGVQEFFEQQSPAALEEITAVMLETIRKGMWKATEQQIADITKLHTDLIKEYRPSCSGFVCDNAKLRDFIASQSDASTAAEYKKSINQIRESATDVKDKGVVMKKDELSGSVNEQKNTLNNIAVVATVVVLLLALLIFIRRKRKKQN